MSKFTTIAIYPDDLEKLNMLATADLRSNPMELRWLIEAEIERREADGIVAVQEIPAPEGAKPVPVYLIKGKQ